MSAGAPRFFCENCGAEVSRDAHSCPQCGRFFSDVRCPSCGFVGAEALFRKGCPACGYSAVRAAPGRAPRPAPRKQPSGSLPLWVYLLTALALAAAAAALLLAGR